MAAIVKRALGSAYEKIVSGKALEAMAAHPVGYGSFLFTLGIKKPQGCELGLVSVVVNETLCL